MHQRAQAQDELDSTMTPNRRLIDLKSIVVIVAVAAWYVFAASHYTVFDDEAFSCRLYAMPMGRMLNLQAVGSEPDPPVYYILQNTFVHAFGVGPLAMRGLSILCALASLLTIRGAGRAWFGERAGFAAMLIAACHPAHLFFGFAARWYALFLLLSTAILWLTGRLYRRGVVTTREAFAWGLVAALCALTNYFGLVITALLGLLLVWRFARVRAYRIQLFNAAVTVIVFFAFWIKPFATHLSTFRESSPSGSTLATLVRMLVALTTGNLASVGAWWVWGPMAIAAILGITAMVRSWRRVAPVAIALLACIVVGSLTRTILDKYILTFSGIACVLLAGLVTRDAPAGPGERRQSLRHIVALCLAVAWIGCGVNLITQRHWSSLRWQDPIESSIGQAVDLGACSRAPIVATHPSVRYYAACRAVRTLSATGAGASAGRGMIEAAEWLNAYRAQDDVTNPSSILVTPTVVLDRLGQARDVSSLFTLQTSGYESLPDWDGLMVLLRADYEAIETRRFLRDDDAALKDKLDPTIHHASWRLTLTHWQRRFPAP